MRRVINVLALVALVALAVGLYRAKTDAKGDRARIAQLEMQLVQERESIRILRNEISYLESPERLRELAREHLGLAPVDPLRVVTLEDAPLLIETPTPADPLTSEADFRNGAQQ